MYPEPQINRARNAVCIVNVNLCPLFLTFFRCAILRNFVDAWIDFRILLWISLSFSCHDLKKPKNTVSFICNILKFYLSYNLSTCNQFPYTCHMKLAWAISPWKCKKDNLSVFRVDQYTLKSNLKSNTKPYKENFL